MDSFDHRSYGNFWQNMYMCSCYYDCLLKYVCGVVAFIFMVMYSTAVHRINSKQKRGTFLDTRDKLLLSTALAEAAAVVSFHIFYVHCILHFYLRVVTIIQQVTILFILAELTDKAVSLMKAFWILVAFCIVGSLTVTAIVIVR